MVRTRRPVGPVNTKRMLSSDDFRGQPNIDKQTIAFLYNAIVVHYGRREAAVIRNKYSKVAELQLKVEFAKLAMESTAFRHSLMNYLEKYVEPEWREAGLKLYREMGVTPENSKPML